MRIIHVTEFDKDNNVVGVRTWEIPNKVFDALMDIASSPVCDTNHEVVIRREAGLFTVWRLPRRQEPCKHQWEEQPGEPPVDVCPLCGKRRE